jgi:hypothetical protein
MSGGDEDLPAFLEGFGFTEGELEAVMDELVAYRSIPGTTLGKYMNRVINTLMDEERPAFLKGVMIGVAIRKAIDALSEPDPTDKERQIDIEIERLRHGGHQR